MFNQFSELFQTSLKKPIDKLVKLNISTASTIAHQQGLLIASLIDNSLSYSRNISSTTDITHLIEEQSKFGADVQSQLTEAIKETSGTFTKAKKDAEAILSDSFSGLSTKSTETVINQPVAPKAAIKTAPKAAVKAAVKAVPKAAVKAVPKAAVKVAPKATVKAVPKAAVKVAPKATVKAVPKAVPKAVVKVAPKVEVAVPKVEVKVAPTTKVNAVPKVAPKK